MTPGFLPLFVDLEPLISRKSKFYIDEQTRESVFGNTRNYDIWSISWLMIRLGNRVNNDGDKIALSALEYLLKQEDPIVRKAIAQVGFGIAEGEEDTTVYWIRQGEPNALDPGVRLPYRIDRYFMTNFEFQQKEKRIRTMYLAECAIMVSLTLLFALFLTGLSQLYGVAISLSLLGISLLVEQHQRTCRRESVEAETIISFFDDAVIYLRAKKSGFD
ncbi:hypothetical protein EU528_05935 [Candidatus Thorarchaeota archaeon]|nr:MAG: hypothetical protein EU528_05935 [Candidatus Thorarchaeota archaeon]